MSQESDQFKASITSLKKERDEIIPFITKLQGDLVAANEAVATAIANGASDKEIADAARESQADIAQVVADMDQFTPEGTPVVPTA